MKPILLAEGITKRFDATIALSNGTLSASRGQVHALLGENGAGKSTFIQILSGAHKADSGSLSLDGKTYRPANPDEARSAGVAVVFQELSLMPDLTVAENVWFRREPRRASMIRRRQLVEQTRDLFRRFEFPPIEPERTVRFLNLAERQIVEIAKALSLSPRVLILDEPTSALPPKEAQWLLKLTQRLASEGVAVIFISHRLDEVRAIASHVTIFRNGATAAHYAIADVGDQEIVSAMIGRRLDRLYPERSGTPGAKPVLTTTDLRYGNSLKGVDLSISAGEILGIAGLQGHGQRELLMVLAGALPGRGSIVLDGRSVKFRSPRTALRDPTGIALVPEDRRHEGLLLGKSIAENMLLSILGRCSQFGLLSEKKIRHHLETIRDRIAIKMASYEEPIDNLSGGNQQKVVFAKALLTNSKVLLLHDPTRGVDVGTKSDIFALMRELANQGVAVVFYSSDLSEIANVSDRVAIMQRGRIAAILEGSPTENDILSAVLGVH